MLVRIQMEGSTPLLQHNIQGVDPDNEMTRQIKALTSKKSKMTEEDRREVERLEWFQGLYLDDDGKTIVEPIRNLKKCFIEAAVVTRNGKDVSRALSPLGLNVPLQHGGNGDLNAMYASGKFRSRIAVGIGQKRTMRVRPEFKPWAIDVTYELFEDIMDLDVLTAIVERAGGSIGLGDNRIGGYGRFVGSVAAV